MKKLTYADNKSQMHLRILPQGWHNTGQERFYFHYHSLEEIQKTKADLRGTPCKKYGQHKTKAAEPFSAVIQGAPKKLPTIK